MQPTRSVPALPDRTGEALLAGAAAVVGSFLAVGFAEAFVGVAVARWLLGVLPDLVFGLGIQYLGDLARPSLVVSATGLAGLCLAAAAFLALRVGARTGRSRLVAVAAALALQAGVAWLLAGDARSAAGAALVGAVAVAAADHAGETESASESGSDGRADRRGVLRAAGVVAASLGLGGAAAARRGDFGGSGDELRAPREGVDDPVVLELLDRAAERSFEIPRLDGLVSEGFYQVDINLTDDPSIAPEEWSLSIEGAVDAPLSVDYADVTDRRTEHRFVTLRCVGDERNGFKIDTALWTGTPLAPLLEEAGVGDDCCVKLEAADGYTHAFPLSALKRGFLAWGMNGKPLPEAHGAPVRVLIPGHWGEVNVKWLTRIEVRDEPATGYWEKRGWHGDGPVETVAKLHHWERDGDRVELGGHAYAGTRGVRRVEVSTDGGETWTDAELSEPLPGSDSAEGRARDAWRMWRYEYEKGAEHEAVVRAVERDGTVQTAEESEAFPRGATGWVRQTIYENRE